MVGGNKKECRINDQSQQIKQSGFHPVHQTEQENHGWIHDKESAQKRQDMPEITGLIILHCAEKQQVIKNETQKIQQIPLPEPVNCQNTAA